MSDTRTALLKARASDHKSVVVQPGELLGYLRGDIIRTGSVRPQGNTCLRMMIARYRHEPERGLALRIAEMGAAHPDADVRAIAAAIGAAA